MTVCLAKKESIKSTMMGLKRLLLTWLRDGKIDKSDIEDAYDWMYKIEACCNLDKTYDEK